MSEKTSQHYHCQICGKVVPLGETLCSQECKDKYQSMVRRRKLILYLMYGVLTAMIVVIAFQYI